MKIIIIFLVFFIDKTLSFNSSQIIDGLIPMACFTDFANMPTKYPQPIYLQTNTNKLSYPTDRISPYFLKTPLGGTIDLYCEHGFYNFDDPSVKIMNYECIQAWENQGGILVFKLKYLYYYKGMAYCAYDLSPFICKYENDAVYEQVGTCANNGRQIRNDAGKMVVYSGKLFDVKFKIPNRNPMVLYKVCYDDVVYETLFVNHVLLPSKFQPGFTNVGFHVGPFYPQISNMENLYINQKKTFETILGVKNLTIFYEGFTTSLLTRGEFSSKFVAVNQ